MSTLNPNCINLTSAEQMIQSYKLEHGSDADFLASEYFDLESLKNILNHPRCKGIRIYNAIKTEGEKKQNRLIVMGIDENGKTLVHLKPNLLGISAASLGISVGFTEEVIGVAEHGRPCPPYCKVD
ncbi:MAG: hypothetical protein IPK91_15430 [Saprospiraceae bacterium]|nr:hypothetical protein [Saprospiraceae bacterium]